MDKRRLTVVGVDAGVRAGALGGTGVADTTALRPMGGGAGSRGRGAGRRLGGGGGLGGGGRGLGGGRGRGGARGDDLARGEVPAGDVDLADGPGFAAVAGDEVAGDALALAQCVLVVGVRHVHRDDRVDPR